MIEFADQSRIYVDTNIWIYYLETKPAFWTKIDQIFELAGRADATLVTSEITIAECLIKPARDKNDALVAFYETFFSNREIEITPLDGLLTRRAALEGGPLGLKLIDAIHFASAREAGCRYFVTGDGRFQSVPDLEVIGLS